MNRMDMCHKPGVFIFDFLSFLAGGFDGRESQRGEIRGEKKLGEMIFMKQYLEDHPS